MAKRDRDREHARPVPQRHTIEIANELREQIVGEEFVDDQLQERARPCAAFPLTRQPCWGLASLRRPLSAFTAGRRLTSEPSSRARTEERIFSGRSAQADLANFPEHPTYAHY